MKHRSKIGIVGLAMILTLVSSKDTRAKAAIPTRSIQEIKYRSNIINSTANDLHLVIKGHVENVRYKTGSNQEKIPNKSMKRKDGTTLVEWDKNSLDNTVNAGHSREVSWKGNSGKIDKTSSETYWTRDGNRLVDSLTSVGNPPEFFFEPFENGAYAFVEFTNPEPFDIVYSALRLFTDGDLALLENDPFDFGIGVEVPDAPDAIYLVAGESAVIDLGLVSNSTFQLAEAYAFAADDPLDLFRVATATSLLPEPNADFNADGAINGDDFPVWQIGFGTATNATIDDGDADGDGKVDGNDFMVWQLQYQGGLAATVGAAAVPEPTTASLVLLGLFGGAARSGRRYRRPDPAS